MKKNFKKMKNKILQSVLSHTKLNQKGVLHHVLPLLLVVVFGVAGAGYYVMSHAEAPMATVSAAVITSGYSGKCLDNWHRGTTVGNKVDLFSCNKTVAQAWGVYSDGTIRIAGRCMATSGYAKTSGTKVVLGNCSNTSTDGWTAKANGNLYNNASKECLTATSNTVGLWLVIDPCSVNLSLGQQWHVPAATPAPTPVPTPSPAPVPPTVSTSAEHIISTLYAYPTLASWTQVETAAPTVKYSIVNICAPNGTGSGCGSPATETNPAWVPTIKTLKADGITPLYYISTNYGALSLTTLESELKNAITWYGVTSPMFDTTATGGTCTNGGSPLPCTTYYKDLYTYSVNSGAVAVVYNPGTTVPSTYMFGSKEIIQVFEGTAAQFEGASFPSWMSTYSPGQFAATLSVGKSTTIGVDVKDAVKDHIGNFYEDDEAESPNYSTLPAFWTTEVTDVKSGV